jgi:hypothetical protein
MNETNNSEITIPLRFRPQHNAATIDRWINGHLASSMWRVETGWMDQLAGKRHFPVPMAILQDPE